MGSGGVSGRGVAAVRIAGRGEDDIAAMRRAGAVVNRALWSACGACVAGATTADVNDAAAREIAAGGAASLFRGYRQGGAPPFPGDACVSVNGEVVHGVPSASRELAIGDVVSVDVGVRLDGWCGDSATSVVVGGGAGGAGEELIAATRRVLELARSLMVPGARWSEIAMALEAATREAGYGYVAEYVGHGIGRELHESPKAPCYWSGYSGPDFELSEGTVIAVEPLLATGRVGPTGRASVDVAEDGWTVRLADRSGVACHEECVVAVSEGGGRVVSGIALE